jgi:ribosome biogenesis GTPase
MAGGTVVKLYSDFADTLLDEPREDGSRLVTARLRGRLARSRAGQKSALAVGDRVDVLLAGNQAVVESARPRRSELTRRDPRHPRRVQVVAANVDRVLVVAAAEAPELSAGTVDRHLVAAGVHGLPAALALTKCDLVASERVAELLAPWRPAGLALFPIARGDEAALEHLRRGWLTGHVTVLVGRSGVGKSTLRNALLGPQAGRAVTAPVSTRTGKGRHATSAATFEPLPPAGFLVDTPGVRELGLAGLRAGDVARHFPELAGLSCRFRDCHHAGEPGCALEAEVAAGAAHPSRLRSLRAIAASLAADR